MIRKVFLAGLILLLQSNGAIAGSGDYSRLARVSYLDGRVSFQHPNEVDWTAASVNMALQPEDRIYTGDAGRAEIEFDEGSVLRLPENTDVELLALNEDLIQIRVLIGLCSLTSPGTVHFEISTPAAVFVTLKKGAYRFDVTENGDTDGIVRKGRMEASNTAFSRQLDFGELMHISPGAAENAQVSPYTQRDTWDDWSDRRDAELLVYDSRRYLPDGVNMGATELDRFGRWVVVDSYGPAWVPYGMDASWSPYSAGRWWYRPNWGWTWVSYEPWGWLPYHYGRWYHHGSFGWCWLPGSTLAFNFWSPGLVRFYYGSSWVSWCPLGPGDYYNVNNYYYSNRYSYQLISLRLTQNRSPQDLVNRFASNAFRTVSTTRFTSSSLGGSDRHSQFENVDQPWRTGRIVTDHLAVEPTSLSYSPAPDRPSTRPSNIYNLPSMVRTSPPSGAASRSSYIAIPSSRTSEENGSLRTNSGLSTSAGEKGRRGVYLPRNESGGSLGTVPADTANPRSEHGSSNGDSRGRIFQGGAFSGSEAAPRPSGREPAAGSRTILLPAPSRTGESSPAVTPDRSRGTSARPEVFPQRRMETPATPAPAPPSRIERTPAPRSEPERSRPPQSSGSFFGSGASRGSGTEAAKQPAPSRDSGGSGSGVNRHRGN
jgi:hypothetical protein